MNSLAANKPVILCIGTTNVVGDSLGPIVGDRLINEYNIDAYVYGKTTKPVNGINYEKYVKHIKTHHKNSLVIAVDACLGKKNDIGRVKYAIKGLKAGAALNKNLARIGDIGILGVVAQSGNNNLQSLIDVNRQSINSLSAKVAQKIYDIIKKIYNI